MRAVLQVAGETVGQRESIRGVGIVLQPVACSSVRVGVVVEERHEEGGRRCGRARKVSGDLIHQPSGGTRLRFGSVRDPLRDGVDAGVAVEHDTSFGACLGLARPCPAVAGRRCRVVSFDDAVDRDSVDDHLQVAVGGEGEPAVVEPGVGDRQRRHPVDGDVELLAVEGHVEGHRRVLGPRVGRGVPQVFDRRCPGGGDDDQLTAVAQEHGVAGLGVVVLQCAPMHGDTRPCAGAAAFGLEGGGDRAFGFEQQSAQRQLRAARGAGGHDARGAVRGLPIAGDFDPRCTEGVEVVLERGGVGRVRGGGQGRAGEREGEEGGECGSPSTVRHLFFLSVRPRSGPACGVREVRRPGRRPPGPAGHRWSRRS